jgi:hypothetical protein
VSQRIVFLILEVKVVTHQDGDASGVNRSH